MGPKQTIFACKRCAAVKQNINRTVDEIFEKTLSKHNYMMGATKALRQTNFDLVQKGISVPSRSLDSSQCQHFNNLIL